MILIFDLDDTLYREYDYVQSGFRAVATYLENKYRLNHTILLSQMNNLLENEGRGNIFDRILELNGLYSKTEVNKCVHTYRHHFPSISLFPEAKEILRAFPNQLYIVTDGHKIVQKNKIEALGVKPYLKKIYITHQYGVVHAKPSVYCFEKIREKEKCTWSKMVYIGDNPNKDFVNLKPRGVHTIRVMMGNYKDTSVDQNYDAEYKILDLSYLKELLLEIK